MFCKECGKEQCVWEEYSEQVLMAAMEENGENNKKRKF